MLTVPLARLSFSLDTISGSMPNLAGEKNVLCVAMVTKASNTSHTFCIQSPQIAINAMAISDHLVTMLTCCLLYLSAN